MKISNYILRLLQKYLEISDIILLFSIFWSSVAYITNEKPRKQCQGTESSFFCALQLVNIVLRALQHVLVLGCSGQNQNLGPLLASLKVTMIQFSPLCASLRGYLLERGRLEGAGWGTHELGMDIFSEPIFGRDISAWQCNTALKQTTSDTFVGCYILNNVYF